jgi:ATP-binding cassette subfamily C protein
MSLLRAFNLVPRRRRWQWLLLVPMALGSALLEGIGAGAVFALGTVLGDPARARSLPLASRWVPAATDPATLIVAISTVAVLFYALRAVLLTLAVWAQDTIVQRTASAVAAQVFTGYLEAPYVFHLRRNSARLIQTAGASVDQAVALALGSTVNLAVEGLTLIGLLAVLAVSAPLAALVAVSAIALLLLVPLLVTRRWGPRLGAETRDIAEALVQDLQQGLASFKDVRVSGAEGYFSERFGARRSRMATLRARQGALTAGVRLSVETILVAALLLTVIVVTRRGMEPAHLVGLMALYAYVGFRVVPSANRLTMNYSYLIAALPHAEAVCDDLEALAAAAPPAGRPASGVAMHFTDRVQLVDIGFAHDDQRRPALHGVSVTIRRGTSLGVVGATGAGKSTLVDVLLGLLTPQVGAVLVDGQDIRGRERDWQARIGYVPQSVALLDDTLRRNVAFGVPDARVDDIRVRNALRLASLLDAVDAWPDGLDTPLGERGARLSGGEQQRVALARALYHDPDVLVLDEATSSLDAQTESAVVAAIEALRGEKTLVVVAHRLATVRHCASVLLLQDGCVRAAGTFDDLLATQPEFRALVAAASA